MPRLLQQVMHVNNDCVHRVMNQPNGSDSLVYSFQALHHAVSVLRDEAVVTDSISTMGTSASPHMPSSVAAFATTSNQQLQHNSVLAATNLLHLACLTGRDPALVSVSENKSGTFYFCDRMILFQNPDTKVQDGDDVTMALISSTLLFNFAIICYRYGMQHSDTKKTLLLQRASKIYTVVIELLLHTMMTSSVATKTFSIYNDGALHQVGNIELLLTLAYNNLGLTYYELCMYAEYNECMIRLNDVFGTQNGIFDLIRPTCFDDIIEEIKLNAIYWKSFAPSPIALAA
jgi:hypothetical protein